MVMIHSSMNSKSLFSLLLLLFSLCLISVSSSVAAMVARESFAIDADVAWVVQISDLHISSYHPERAGDLVALLAPALRVIRPALLLITGDITDAKRKDRTSSRQDEQEWVIYRNVTEEIVKISGIDKQRIFDIRGNHDKYGVPYVNHKLDFFSNYSVNSRLNRTALVYSISLSGNGMKYQFLGIDDSIPIGIRRPANLFGHPTIKLLHNINSELESLNNYENTLVTKIIFGHFPLSFTASSESGSRYETLFAEQSVSAYICGHLHAKLSKNIRKLHNIDHYKNFWEWELGDWKDNRLIRILTIDKGVVSFVNFQLSDKLGFETKVVVTYPTDSRSMNRFGSINGSIRNDINALVFSSNEILNVTARVFDSFRDFKIVEEIPMQNFLNNNNKVIFHAKWNAEIYTSEWANRYWLKVFALDSKGKESTSEMRPFSVEDKGVIPSNQWLNYLLLGVKWENLYLILLWINLGFIISLISFPKIMYHFFKRGYQKWVISVFSSPINQNKKHYFWLLWFSIEGSRSKRFWFSLVIYIIWLIKFPWFWGYATLENYEIAPMYLTGWRIKDLRNNLVIDKVGYADLMVIILPFLYFVVSPVVLIIYGLFAERSVHYLSVRRGIKVNSRKWRIALFVACALVALVHFKLCYTLMLAYGVAPVILSPALTWVPPLLLITAVYSTNLSLDYDLVC